MRESYNNVLKMVTEDLRGDEGFRGKPYDDATGLALKAPKGNITIGYGRNLDAKPLTRYQSEFLLQCDIGDVMNDLARAIPWFNVADDTTKRVMINMCYNMGLASFLGFKKMLRALENGMKGEAAKEIMDSNYYRGVTNLRARRMIALLGGAK